MRSSACLIGVVFLAVALQSASMAQSGGTPEFTRTIIQAPGTPQPHYHYAVNRVPLRDIVALEPTSPVAKPIGLFWINSGGFRSSDVTYWSGDNLRQFYPFLRQGYFVFILTHPDGTDGALPLDGAGNPEPVWLSSEIEEYVRRSVLEIKRRHSVSQGTHPTQITDWAIMGGSAGGVLALRIGLAGSGEWLEDATDPAINTGMQAVVANSAGIDLLNYRFPGDYSWVCRTVYSLVHPDLRSVNPNVTVAPTPATLMNLPSHYSTATQIAWPPTLGNLVDNGNPGSATYPRFPELFLAATSSVTSYPASPAPPSISLRRFLDYPSSTPDTYDSAIFEVVPGGGVDPTLQSTYENHRELDPVWAGLSAPTVYELPGGPPGWDSFIMGHQVIDLIDQTDPPVFYRHGDRDYIVHYHQAEIYQSMWPLGAPGTSPRFVARPGWGHGWRDIDGEDDARAIVNFLQEVLENPNLADKDLDSLPNSLESSAFNAADPDIDGDGQLDGAELAYEQLLNPTANVTAANSLHIGDPALNFRILDFKRQVVPTNNNKWEYEIEFTGDSSVSYAIQRCDNPVIYDRSLDKERHYLEPTWTSVSTNVNWLTNPAGNPTASYRIPISAGTWKAQFYRVAVLDSTGQPIVTTAPVGIFRNTIRRGDPTLNPNEYWANFVSSPFQTGQVGRYRLESAAVATSGTDFTRTDLLLGTSTMLMAPGLGMGTVASANTQLYTHYALVERDNSIVRPDANPDDRGTEGHWWFIDDEITGPGGAVIGVTVAEWSEDVNGPIQRASALPASPLGSGGVASISIRPLPSIGSIFDGAQVSGSTTQWYTDHATAGSPPSPFREGDQIYLVQRHSWSNVWAQPITPLMMPQRIASWAPTPMTFVEDLSGNWGQWEIPGVPTSTVVDLFEYRIRPDECIVYIAARDPSDPGVAESVYYSHGWVPTGDLYAYVNADNDLAAGNYSVMSGGQYTDHFGVGIQAWPFPADCYLATSEQATSGFFGALPIPSDVPATSVPGGPHGGASFMVKGDVDSQAFWGDDPAHASFFFGANNGDHPYYLNPIPTIRGYEMDSAIGGGPSNFLAPDDYRPYFNDGLDRTGQTPMTGTPFGFPAKDVVGDRLMMRAGRGFTVFSNLPANPAESNLDKRIVPWRMRRPYRRP